MMKNGKFNDVPLLIGANENEGMAFINMMPNIIKTNWPLKVTDEKSYLQGLGFFTGRGSLPPSQNTQDIWTKIAPWYFQNEEFSSESGGALITDSWFVMPNVLTTQILLEKATSPIFQYSYAHHGSFTFCDVLNFGWKNWLGKMVMRFFGSDAFVKVQYSISEYLHLTFQYMYLTYYVNCRSKVNVKCRIVKCKSTFSEFGLSCR